MYVDIPGADVADGDVLVGSGQMLAAGLSADLDGPGVYRVDLNAVWSLSVEQETVVAWFVLECAGDGVLVAEQEVKMSLGNANASAVQTHTPFTVSTFVELSNAGTIDCVLRQRLEVAGDGNGILFHGIDGYLTGEVMLVDEG